MGSVDVNWDFGIEGNSGTDEWKINSEGRVNLDVTTEYTVVLPKTTTYKELQSTDTSPPLCLGGAFISAEGCLPVDALRPVFP